MTSLIDVIFLLLLFFMLSSTFTRFAEIELRAGGSDGGATRGEVLFVQLGETALTVNGQTADLDTLPDFLRAQERGARLIVSLSDDASAQRLSDLLVALAAFPDLPVTVLGDA
ncbi:biopolymer transporter ExbD [Aestuariivita boseongensis]|uniref:biopolymer transporter ExbD n=1 Tax=Aestuariivita boseongensis TaxID=1470562 RepID=UPI000680DB33|nr:biopolymer transporter ExbD [Aestuariivita boseongensis]